MPAADTVTPVPDRLIRFGDISYTYHLRAGEDRQGLRRLLHELGADRFILVADHKVPRRYVETMRTRLNGVAPCTLLTIHADEHQKTLGGVENLARAARRAGVTRNSVVVAFGGGLAGNVAGLLAGLLYRGTRLVHFPTTLLAILDSTLSLKQAVNLEDPEAEGGSGKNILGLFKPPEWVWADLTYCESLPPAQINSGLGELIKNVLAICPERFDWAMARLNPHAQYTLPQLAEFTSFCVNAKLQVMKNDPEEKKLAVVLEYGHTTAHAAELLVPGGVAHGLAVGLGMLAAARVARELGYLTAADENAHRALLERAGAPVTLPYRVPIRDFLAVMHLDNKRGYRDVQAGTVDMVLLNSLGSPHMEEGTLITHVPDQVVTPAVEDLMPSLPARRIPAAADAGRR